MSVISVCDLKKYFGEVRAVDGISFAVEKGEVFGFLGPNGAGKTTTIRCLMDFIRPDAGTISILGFDARKNSPQLKQKIGYLSGEVSFYENWTGQEHLNFVQRIKGKLSSSSELCDKLSFDPGKKVKHLSSGNKQKLGLILALMGKPEVLILDEPTLGLDPLLQNTIHNILKDFASRGCAIFMSSHNLTEVEHLCSKVGIIKEGKLVSLESVNGLKKKKLYTVSVSFHGNFSQKDFTRQIGGLTSQEVEVRQVLPDGLILSVKRDINPLIAKLAKFDLKSLEITHATLEEVFLEFYQ